MNYEMPYNKEAITLATKKQLQKALDALYREDSWVNAELDKRVASIDKVLAKVQEVLEFDVVQPSAEVDVTVGQLGHHVFIRYDNISISIEVVNCSDMFRLRTTIHTTIN